MKILIIKWGALGDVIRTSYILTGLHLKYNCPDIYWFTAPETVDLLRFNPYICQIITPFTGVETLYKTVFDLVISLDDETHILKYLRQIKYRHLIGAYLDRRGKAVYEKKSAYWFNMGLISKFGKKKADILKKLNKKKHNQIFAEMLGVPVKEPMFFNSPLIEAKINRMFSRKYFNIGLNSAAGNRWPSKALLLDETVKLIEKLLHLKTKNKKICVYLLGGKEEGDRHLIIRRAIKSSHLKDTDNNNTLLEFAAIIKNLDYIITTDSLALHLAISQKVANLSFYAPTPAAEIGTFGTGIKIRSTSDDYASYRPQTDNSSITAEKICFAFSKHSKCVN